MFLCKNMTNNSLTSIGKLLNKKDHTTIIHGIRKIEDEMKVNEELRNKVNIIKNIISPSS